MIRSAPFLLVALGLCLATHPDQPLLASVGDGTTHVIFEPLDFIARLAALVPKPRVNLTRFHGVFAPNSKYRARVTPARRGRGGRHARTADPEERTPAEGRAAMTWAQRLKRVLFRASCPPPFGPACGCSKSLQAI